MDEDSEGLEEQLKEVYNDFDPDGNGITIDELEEAMKSMGQNPTRQELEQMMAAADEDQSGVIDFNEFKNMMRKQMNEQDVQNELEVAFSAFDRDGSGSISRDELSYIMLNCGTKEERLS